MKRNNKNKKRYNGIPNGIQRLDKETMSEIAFYYSITKSIEATCKAYGVSRAMVEYSIKNGCSFDSLQRELIKEENEWWIIQ